MVGKDVEHEKKVIDTSNWDKKGSVPSTDPASLTSVPKLIKGSVPSTDPVKLTSVPTPIKKSK